MFQEELERLKTMIGEVVFPTESHNSDALPKEYCFKNNRKITYTLGYDNYNESYVATTDYLFSGRYDPDNSCTSRFINVKIWCKKSGTDMDTIEVDLEVSYVVKGPRPEEHIKKHESIVPDCKYLEDMDMQKIEQVALLILKQARTMMHSLNERINA